MSSLSIAPDESRLEWFAPSRPGRAERFLEEARAAIESRLDEECAVLGSGLERLGIGEVIERAVGTRGRGGGRWRPLLTLAASHGFGGVRRRAMDAAVAVELTHTASLVLDDLPCMDDADTRRGQPATHRMVGSAGAILLSVGLLARAAELLGRDPACGGELAEAWGRTFGLQGMAGGQAVDVALSESMSGSERRLHRAKSTVLPAFALFSGARSAGAGPADCEALAAFGRGLGWAYQLRDDEVDREEDARNGRVPLARRPGLGRDRILRLATRRLERAPGLSSEGIEILTALAGRIVPTDDAAADDAAAEGGH